MYAPLSPNSESIKKSLLIRFLLGIFSAITSLVVLAALGFDWWQSKGWFEYVVGLYSAAHVVNGAPNGTFDYGLPVEPSRMITLICLNLSLIMQLFSVVHSAVTSWKRYRERVLNQYIALTIVNFLLLMTAIVVFGIWAQEIGSTEEVFIGPSFALVIGAAGLTLINFIIILLVKTRMIGFFCSPLVSGLTCTRLLTSRHGRLCLLFTFMLLFYLFYLGASWSVEVQAFEEESTGLRTRINTTRGKEVLSSLCDAYNRNEVSGDACHRLCFNQDWTVVDFYEGNKVVVVIKDGEQQAVFKSLLPSIKDYEEPPEGEKEDQFLRRIRDKTYDELMFGWPTEFIDHLLSILWPRHLISGGQQLSPADRRSLWALMQQPEYLTFRILPLSRVTPKVIGSCGHMYKVESLVAFRMKGFYMNLKGKILVHLMGTLQLFYEFLNEPLQWCDVRFDNLGLSAKYPKRFVMTDGDLLFTESKLKALMAAKSCKTDADCAIGDCTSRCQSNFKCGPRNNENLDVFCEKLINKLFGDAWRKKLINKLFGNAWNKYLNACNNTVTNTTTKLNDLRLTWAHESLF